ncbi:hypothetical protein HBI56_051450 [Parastagonospora nodorum]|uniref:Uncharacterized protein n=1 Tax=Phaeosphaeria nodorum (strain SN15 / ATCC MYA-4574 / FGSC 10173) TaxID=321614 RepID=A0A7U2NRA3_PHANO|nr:hypothetical protein HBH56_100710 [Parastagonospora nodorum]QRD07547.1 hypothetical protein JI435_424580 [Parastagonospora nodorum SN15]KAH3930489.1 hypothetical protein HBH54_115030 [Parastagonospora nodorum]KAH3942870.1 hypothetical protein HBH53_180770 [Parastagonospora nodorum]KAH3964647.1 hypothetical protein HBH51_157040 [Parastagonospora nodorum]
MELNLGLQHAEMIGARGRHGRKANGGGAALSERDARSGAKRMLERRAERRAERDQGGSAIIAWSGGG